MNKILRISEALLGFYGCIYSILYYFGKLKLSSEQEARRRKVMENYGFVMLILAFFLFMVSSMMLSDVIRRW